MDIIFFLFEGFVWINCLWYMYWIKKEKEWDYLVKKNDLVYWVVEVYYKVVLDKKFLELVVE